MYGFSHTCSLLEPTGAGADGYRWWLKSNIYFALLFDQQNHNKDELFWFFQRTKINRRLTWPIWIERCVLPVSLHLPTNLGNSARAAERPGDVGADLASGGNPSVKFLSLDGIARPSTAELQLDIALKRTKRHLNQAIATYSPIQPLLDIPCPHPC